MSTATEHFGKGVDTSKFTPSMLSSTGQQRCCIGGERKMPESRWYGVKTKSGERYPASILSFCQHCGENGFKANEVFEIREEEYPGLKSSLVCDAPYTKKYIDIIGNRRCVLRPFTLPNGKTVRMQFNVNVTDEKDVEWTPVLLGATPADEAAAAAGTLRAKIPTHSYWQFVVQAYSGDLDDLPDNLWFKIDSAKFKDGREVKVTDQSGSTNFVTPLVNSQQNPGQVIVKGYRTGVSGQNFFFVAPAEQEKDAGLAASHDCMSNILELVISIHEGVREKPIVYRGSGPETKGCVTRGGSGVTRGGSGGKLTGGSNFGASGFSENVRTSGTVRLKYLDRVACTIQLVNDETNSERLHFAKMVEDQTQAWRDSEVERLERERASLLGGTPRSRGMADILKTQSNHLV